MNQIQNILGLLEKTPESVKQFHSKMYIDRIGQLEHEWTDEEKAIKDVLDSIQAKKDEAQYYKALLRQLEGTPDSELIDITPTEAEIEKEIQVRTLAKSSNGHDVLLGDQSYSPSLSLSKKLQWVLSIIDNDELDTRAMCELLITQEPDILKKYKNKFDTLQKSVGTTLLQKIQNDTIFYRDPLPLEQGQKQVKYKYGLKAWKEQQSHNNQLFTSKPKAND